MMATKRHVGTTTWALLGAVLTAGLVMIGCSDHRISYEEFLNMQQPEPAAESPSIEPVDPAVIDQKLGPYRVGPGDVLNVVVTSPDPSNPVPAVATRVTSGGEIHLHLAGKVKVGGQTLEEVEESIRKAYISAQLFKEILVNVTLAEVQTTDVLVVGAVEAPGLIPLRRTERNLLYAVVRAGGVSQLSSGKVTLRRLRDPKPFTADLQDPAQVAAALRLPPLQAGDIVEVEAVKPNTIFVGGLVNAPHPQIYDSTSRVTILQALAAAGGLRTDVFPKEGTLIRRQNGKDIHVKLDLDRLAEGKDPNIALAPGDILWVPETFGTRAMDFFNRTFSLHVGANASTNATYSLTSSQRRGDDKNQNNAFILP